MNKFFYILLILFGVVQAEQNQIYIEQIGINNQFIINQDGIGHSVIINAGLASSLDSSTVSISQQGLGIKSASVELPSGYNNTVNISQDGLGAQTALIQNFSGSANNISILQSGSSNNTFSLIGSGTNNANTISVVQNGLVGADKSFTLNMTSTNGATVNISQTNSTAANSGSMTISCLVGCGTYSYSRP